MNVTRDKVLTEISAQGNRLRVEHPEPLKMHLYDNTKEQRGVYLSFLSVASVESIFIELQFDQSGGLIKTLVESHY